MFRPLGILVAVLLFVSGICAQAAENSSDAKCGGSSHLAQYEGRYELADGLVLIAKVVDGELTVRPIVWTSVQALEPTGCDSFGIKGRSDRRVSFGRNADGRIDEVTIAGFGSDGTFKKLGEEKLPIEAILAGEPEKAAAQIISTGKKDPSNAVELGRTVLQMVPSKANDVIGFLTELSRRFPNSSIVYSALGDGFASLEDWDKAKASFRKAYEIDPENKDAARGLRLLGLLKPSAAEAATGWKLPFSLDRLFGPPTAAEIKAAEADWASRDLSPKDVRQEAAGSIDLGRTEADVRIISFLVHGQRNFGAVIVPRGEHRGPRPVILDLKGVSPDFFPLELEKLISPGMLGEAQANFVYFVPSFRGETLKFAGREYKSEGDPTDSWDGATDDSLAFLDAALSVTPQADGKRIAAFGKSRGGTLAMLAGIRDKRIKAVVSWSGPVDWFELMGDGGWPEKATISEALSKKAEPRDDGGQFIKTFLTEAIRGKRTLAQVRRHMLQSSPLYFASQLPATEAFYGVEDRMVPVRNGRALERVLRGLRSTNRERRVYFEQAAGHDLNPKDAIPESKRFLMTTLLSDQQARPTI